MKYITQLIKMTDKWIYAQIQKGQFPKPLKLGRSSRWKYSEICDWLERVEHARKL
ncbi:helix-turn-helix transcriptional regulator [Scandinavium sp.]|uniref:helix-turn-helix transcriptional regulator n=1 Tax=Scandinavium sp. TaxID=2830653 RepID=UPI00390CBEBB